MRPICVVVAVVCMVSHARGTPHNADNPAVKRSRDLQAADLSFDAIDVLSSELLSRSPHDNGTRASLLTELSRAYGIVKNFTGAVAAAREALEVTTSSSITSSGGSSSNQSFSIVLAYVALIEALVCDRRYGDALQALHSARDVSQLKQLPPLVLRALDRTESTIRDCQGDSTGALRAFRRGLGINGDIAAGSLWPSTALKAAGGQQQQAIEYLQLLWRLADDPVRPQYLAREIRRVEEALLELGPWQHPMQLPRAFEPGLRSSPWHHTRDTGDNTRNEGELVAGFPELRPVIALIESSYEGLLSEYNQLRAHDALLPETECIHDARSGHWAFYTSTGHWIRNRTDGCSADLTPLACSIKETIDGLRIPRVRVLRVGWSVVGGRSVLRPHCGVTNAQLKFHLGLVVPTVRNYNASAAISPRVVEGLAAAPAADDEAQLSPLQSAAAPSAVPPVGAPCATLTVGGVTKAWKTGRTLFFDDSWKHSVVNACDEERVIFQCVISHPDYDIDERSGVSVRNGGRSSL